MQTAATLSPEESAIFFEHRFRFTDREHPAMDVIFHLAKEWEAQEYRDQTPVMPRKAPAVLPRKADPIDIMQLEIKLPPLPAILIELQQVLARDNVSAEQIAEIISRDAGLTAWLLRLVNSPYYGFTTKVASVTAAVNLVGTGQIKILATGESLHSLAVMLPAGVMDIRAFWRHSLAVAIASQELAMLSGHSDPEQLFVAGLLHDCGKLAVAYAAPKLIASYNEAEATMEMPDFISEQEVMGFDHARLGSMLLHRWNMPLPLIMAVLRHHSVEAPDRYPEIAITHVAEVLVMSLGINIRQGGFIPPLDATAWRCLGLEPEQLRYVSEMLRAKLDSICAAMQPETFSRPHLATRA